MNFTFGEVLISIRNNLLTLRINGLIVEIDVHFIVGIVCHMRGWDIFSVAFDSGTRCSCTTVDTTGKASSNTYWTWTTSATASYTSTDSTTSIVIILWAEVDRTSYLIVVMTLHVYFWN